jgi:hypothetical protein
MEAVRTSETSVNFNVTTRRYIPEDSKLHIRRRENLNSHSVYIFCQPDPQSAINLKCVDEVNISSEDDTRVT